MFLELDIANVEFQAEFDMSNIKFQNRSIFRDTLTKWLFG